MDISIYPHLTNHRSQKSQVMSMMTVSYTHLVDVCEGWNFTGWIPSPIGQRVNSNMTFTAQYDEVVSETPAIPPISPEPSIPLDSPTEEPTTEPEDVFYHCRFEAGEHGYIEGSSSFRKAANTTLSSGEIPIVTPNKGYKLSLIHI